MAAGRSSDGAYLAPPLPVPLPRRPRPGCPPLPPLPPLPRPPPRPVLIRPAREAAPSQLPEVATSGVGRTSAALAALAAFLDLFLLDHVDDLVRDPEVLDRVAADVALRQLPEAVAVPGGADDLLQVDVPTMNE